MRFSLFLSLPLLLVLLAGCEEDQPLVQENPPKLEPSETILVNETVKVGPGEYKSWAISMNAGDTLLKGVISSSADVDIWLLSSREFQAFQKSESFQSIHEGSRQDTYGFSFEFSPPELGKYHFVIDNRESWITSKAVYVSLTKVGYF